MEPLKLLVIFAHPDDESMGMGATLAKYAAEGVETHLICASRGERGWGGAEEQNPGLEQLGKIRTMELERAVALLGMKSLSFLGYIDGEVDRAHHAEAIGRIVTHIRRIRPQVVVTFPHDGIYGHPDHIAIGQFATAAIVCAADADYKDSERFSPIACRNCITWWTVKNLCGRSCPFSTTSPFRWMGKSAKNRRGRNG